VGKPSITYTPRPDATPERELSALAAIYKLCINSHGKKSAVGAGYTDGDDAKARSKDDSSAKSIIQDRT